VTLCAAIVSFRFMVCRSRVAAEIALAKLLARNHGGLFDPGFVAQQSTCMTGR
jgi:hypothetical protein